MSSKRSITTIFGAAAVACAVTATPAPAAAQEADPVTPTGKGIAGGILLGAEVVLLPLGIAGVDAWWPYVVFGVVGAGAGAFGGCAAEGSQGACSSFMTTEIPAEVAVGLLAGGMALVIPTLVVILNATAYDPEKELEEGDDKKQTPGEETEIEVEGKHRIPALQTHRLAFIGVDATGKRVRVRPGVPAVDIRPMYTPEEVAVWGVEQETEVVVPLVRGRF